MIPKKNKGNPRWVRSGQGNKKNGFFHWEYRSNGNYYAKGYYHTAQEAYDACLSHQEMQERWRNPENCSGVLVYGEEEETIDE